MLSLTRLLTGEKNYGDSLRYTKKSRNQMHGVSEGRGPVVSWNYTRTCNLKCRHCYSNSEAKAYENELTTEEALKTIDDLADFNVPVILFSGGEPLARDDFFTLACYARDKGIRVTLSTNGTLITPEIAKKIKEHEIGYVGISIDGKREVNDKFRGVDGAFDMAMEGIRNCRAVDQRVGLRFTITKDNYKDIGDVLDLVEEEDINRICFYHLVYSGRGEDMVDQDLSPDQTKAVVDLIAERTIDFYEKGLDKEILLVANHADAPYLYLKYKDINPERAEIMYELLSRNGGNRSGIAFSNIDNEGNVHPDQFTHHHNLGNVKDKPFKEIWTNMDHPILAGLKDRKALLDEKCQKCSWLSICNGNFRARGEAVTGDFWGFDPACYLTDEERAYPRPEENRA